MNNKLWGSRFYLAGPIDLDTNRGIDWRRNITPFLESIGGVVIDPTDKPIGLVSEKPNDIKRRKQLKQTEQYDKLAKEMKLIRCVDLRCVDLSDILICHLDLNIYSCGTWEEIGWANRCKKPILVHFEQGKKHANDWLFGQIPSDHIFSTWDDLKIYLLNVHKGKDTRHYKRFFFFNYDKMLPKVDNNGSVMESIV